jgi:hypothetical protein
VKPAPFAVTVQPDAVATLASSGVQVVPAVLRTSVTVPSPRTATTATPVVAAVPVSDARSSSVLSSMRANTPRTDALRAVTTPEAPRPSPSQIAMVATDRKLTPAPTVLYRPSAAPVTAPAVPSATPALTRKRAIATWTIDPLAGVPVGLVLIELNDRLPSVFAVVAALLTGGARSVALPWPIETTCSTALSKSMRKSYEPIVFVPVFT